MKYLIAILSTFVFVLSSSAFSKEAKKHDSHSHDEKEGSHSDKGVDHQDHSDRDDHDHAEGEKPDEHDHEGGHEEEESANIGPEKGILEADEKNGFKLAPQVFKNFEIQTLKLSGSGPWMIPLSARLISMEEVNLYRVRNGFFKRIDFNISKKSSEQLTISSVELKPGDEIATTGIGYLRIVELAAFGGVADSHSH